MRKFLSRLFVIFACIFGIFGGAFACSSGQIDVNGDGTNCVDVKFSVTTTNLEADTEFKFSMSAQGTFYVDWGDGDVQTIDRTDTSDTTYQHTYTSNGVKTIRMTGLATTYSTDALSAAISFGTYSSLSGDLISSIEGSLGAMFPTLEQNNGQQPKFKDTFFGAGLTSIPENLFSGITGSASNMFYQTFFGCTNLTTIPAGLFSGITGAANSVFFETFKNCTKLTSIPENLFSGITGAAYRMFYGTFYGCSSLTTIPSRLFNGVTGAAISLFKNTFFGTKLTSIPENLFSGITGAAGSMFDSTFGKCTSLTGYIPPSTFAGLINNNSPVASDMWYYTFDRTALSTSCPEGTQQFITGYEGSNSSVKWNGQVSCYVPAEYDITYEMNGGTNYTGAPTTYMSGTGVTIDGTPTKFGYKFTGWCTDSELTDCAMTQTVGKASFSNKIFYANWTALYNINYELNGGTNYENAPMEYTEGTGATIDGVPTKAGYTFTGWCTDSGLENCAMSQTIGTDATGDKTFYAKWTECQACAAVNASCMFDGVVNNQCTYTTACNAGYGDIQNNGAYNASCSACTPCDAINASCELSTVDNQCTYTTACNADSINIQNNGAYNASCTQCQACAAVNASCTFDGVVNNQCTYTTACNSGYSNIQNNGAYNASCSGNAINITWNGAAAEDISTNDAAQTFYGDDIRTPVQAEQLPGRTFKGWKFEKPAQE